MKSGTSFSAAYISGLVALMLERNPALKPDEVRAIVIKTARDLGAPGRDDLFGAGEADAFAAVPAAVDAPARRLPWFRCAGGDTGFDRPQLRSRALNQPRQRWSVNRPPAMVPGPPRNSFVEKPRPKLKNRWRGTCGALPRLPCVERLSSHRGCIRRERPSTLRPYELDPSGCPRRSSFLTHLSRALPTKSAVTPRKRSTVQSRHAASQFDGGWTIIPYFTGPLSMLMSSVACWTI